MIYIYGFILGREAELSKAEIFQFIKKYNKKYEIILNTKSVLIVATNLENIPINKLGGTIKLFKLLDQNIDKNQIQKIIQSKIEINQLEKRINFGISGYGKIQSNFIYSIGKKIKDNLIKEDYKARFVTGKYKDLSSVIVTENKLLERGFEAIIVEDNNKYFLGQTIEVQNYKSYSKRDFGRTARDDKSGMLPPKLAQILINLTSKSEEKNIYDPFCGSGTLIQEAILMGYQNVFASDVSQKAINDTKENIMWLVQKEKENVFDTEKINKNIFLSDILQPSKNIKVDAVVGEGYLGAPKRRNVAEAKKDAITLTDFYLKAFANISRMLNDDGIAVIAVPFFIIGKVKVFLNIPEKLHLTNLRQVELCDNVLTSRNTLLYSRPDAFVGREIYILERA